jgi:Zn-dependent peptidase ImmA (M78 family)
VSRVLLPDWWDEACDRDLKLLPDVEIRVARFLGLPLPSVRDPATALRPQIAPGAQLRRVRDLDRDRLAPAIHAAMQVAAAVVRSMRPAPGPVMPPTDALVWRNELAGARAAVKLDHVLSDLWRRGIPVVPLNLLPSPSFQGLACIVEGRPAIVISHKHDEPGRIAFWVAHETGHIAAGDCAPDRPVVDEEEEVPDDSDIERAADQYATRVFVGDDLAPEMEAMDFKDLAKRASRIERETSADASAIIFAWASRTREYAIATMAVNALYRGSGARRRLRQHLERHVDFDAASETDRALLRCMYGEPERDARVA